MQIIPLSEGTFSIDASKKFIPFNLEKDSLKDRPPGSILVEINPFCVVTKNDVIVLDTGLGYSHPDGSLQIHQNLLNNGISPMDVTMVLLSHLHKDHAGGIAIEDKVLGKSFFSFPNAVYYLNEKELPYAFEKNGKSYVSEEFKLLKDSDNAVMLPEEGGEIEGYIRYAHSGAHCPHHIVFWIEEDGQTIFFGGDEAPQLQQMKNKFIAKYDYDGKKAMELRQQWWKEGQEKHWNCLFYHDARNPFIAL